MLNTENCILLTTVASLTTRKCKRLAIFKSVKELEKAVEKYTETCVIKFYAFHNAENQTFELKNPFVPLRILCPKVSKINKLFVIFKENSNRMCSFTLKVGNRHLCNERSFLWRRREQSLSSTKDVT
jgi:hypothetical protein